MTFEERIAGFEKYDCVHATVTRHAVKGVLLTYGEGLVAFANATLPVGAKVLATIRKIDMEKEFTLMAIDSVLAA